MKLLRFLLFPFSVLYDGVTSLRNFCYTQGIFKSTRFDIPVIAVGNLSVGGTGKTPQIEYLIRLLQDRMKVAVLSRGYKRNTKGFLLIHKEHTAEDVGDEPLQFFKKFPNITVAVDAQRVNGIQKLQKQVRPDIVLLDDAFQHRRVKASFYVLLTKYGDLFANDFLLPTGNLRESRRGAKRADVIIVTKCPKNLSEEEKKQLTKKLQTSHKKPVFFTQIDYFKHTQGAQNVSLSDLENFEILLVTGIANPKPLLTFLEENKCKVQHLNFSDHHNFSKQEIQQIQQKYHAIASSNKILLTTEKDYMRLYDKLSDLSYLEIESQFVSHKQNFDQLILQSTAT